MSEFAAGNVTALFFYDIMRLDEKLLLNALRERARVEPVHTARLPLPLGGEPPWQADIAVARGVSHAAAFYSAVAAESWGLPVVNPARGLAVARDKAWSQAVLARHGIPTPRAMVAVDPEALPEAASALGYPVVVKPLKGSWGRLVNLARDEVEARALAEHKAYLPEGLKGSVVQEYIRKPGRDLRVFCIGDTVPAGIYRIHSGLATNVAQGARAEPVKITGEIEDLAVRSCRALGLEIGGVDLIEDPGRGLLVLEVNPTPEFKTTQRVTGVDVAGLMAEHIVSLARR